MNYPRIFERVYLRPVGITVSAFRSIHQVLRPRLLGNITMPDKLPEGSRKRRASNGRQDRPEPTTSDDGRVLDDRLYSMVGPGVATFAIKGILARNVGALEAAFCGMAGYEQIQAVCEQLMQAHDVSDVIGDFDTPGGECAGCPETVAAIQRLAAVKRVVSFSDGMACSCGYDLACAAPEIYGTESAIFGSVGIITGVLDDTKALLDEGLVAEYFTAGEHKAIGRTGYSLTDSDRDSLQAEVDYLYSQFAARVMAARGNIAPLVKKSAELYIGQQAVIAGLADAITDDFAEVVQMLVDDRQRAPV